MEAEEAERAVRTVHEAAAHALDRPKDIAISHTKSEEADAKLALFSGVMDDSNASMRSVLPVWAEMASGDFRSSYPGDRSHLWVALGAFLALNEDRAGTLADKGFRILDLMGCLKRELAVVLASKVFSVGPNGWPRRDADNMWPASTFCATAWTLALARHERAGCLTVADQPVLAAFRAHPIISRHLATDANKGEVWFALLKERLHRYPLDDRQVAPTQLGNAIRRFEEYGYDRFRLDSQVLWHELNAAAPDSARQQTDDARMSVDFFISLLYGHLLVVAAAIVDLAVGNASPPWLVAVTIAGLLLTMLWYRLAVVATDEWAGAVRAMVNLGQHPLAAAFGLTLPQRVEDERAMWRLTSHLVGTGFSPGLSALDAYRTAPGEASGAPTPTLTHPTLPAARSSPAAPATAVGPPASGGAPAEPSP
ncbi:hypothetical protein [Streptomyces misionensis]|nr:hypothetical protein [Streptomyces misionensis]